MDPVLVVKIVGGLVAIAIIGLILNQGYIKAPPDTAYIISGLFGSRLLVGKAGFKIPFLERVDALYLGQISVDIKTEQPVPTNDFINVNVDAVAKVRVIDSDEGIKLAARNFLNMHPSKIAQSLADSLQGNMREIIGTLSLEKINTDRDSFSNQVEEKAEKDMHKLGIEVISCNIQNVTDEHGLIKDLGADNTYKIRKNAAITKAQAERDINIAQATADKEANDARVKADTEIAERNNELEIKKAELKKQADIKKAEADAAYEIQNQEQQKSIQEATVNAQIKRAEREAELKKQEVEVTQQRLAAQIGKQADAEKYKIEQEAQAELARRQREAEAAAYEKEQEARAQRAIADAQKYTMEQEAAGIRAKGEAEAAAIQARGEAEAAAMDKKAEAYNKYNKAAVAEMVIRVMPEIAGKIAEPLKQIDKITVISGDGSQGGGVAQVANSMPIVMSKLFETMKETTGVDLGEIMKAQTYDAKVNKNINISGLEKERIKDVLQEYTKETTTKPLTPTNNTTPNKKVKDEEPNEEPKVENYVVKQTDVSPAKGMHAGPQLI